MIKTENADEKEHSGPLSPQRKKRRKKMQQRSGFSKKTTQLLQVDIMHIIHYALSRLTWDEAKHSVFFLEALYGLNPPPIVKAGLRKIYRKFGRKLYGPVVKTSKVVMEQPIIKGAINSIKNNKNVNL